MEMCRPVKREKPQLSVYLLMSLNGWIDDRVGGQRSESEWWQMGRIMMNDAGEETGRCGEKDGFKKD